MKTNRYILLVLLMALLGSCTEKIDLELNDGDNNRLVIDGGITTDTTQHVIKLTRTTSYFYNQPAPRETGATVTLTDGTEVIVLTETEPGIYKTAPTVAGKFGHTYTLNITLQDGEKYSATSAIDTVAAIDEITYYYDQNYEAYILQLHAQEPEGKGDNYMFNIYLDGKLDNDTLRETSFEGDELFDGMYIPGLDFYEIDADQIENDSVLVRVDMLSMSDEQLEYYYALMNETDWRGGPFDGPPANVPSNISNGALGFFWASGISSYSFYLKKEH